MQTCSSSSGNFKYGGLATVWDIHDDQFIRALMNEDDTERDSFWIGLYHDPNVDPKNWLWEDQHSLTYTNWAENEPKNGQKSCGMIKQNGQWETGSCTTQRGFICRLEAEVDPNGHNGFGQCDPGWTLHSGYCYKHTDAGWYGKIWFEAQADCELYGAGSLVSIHSETDKRWLSSVDMGDSWIGLKRNDQTDDFEWADGTRLDFTSWEAGEPNNGGEGGTREPCVKTNGQGFWNDVVCEDYKNWICRKPAKYSFCTTQSHERESCGSEGTTEEDCRKSGCCWDNNVCFHASNSVECVEKEGFCTSVSGGNTCDGNFEKALCGHEDRGCCMKRDPPPPTTTTQPSSSTPDVPTNPPTEPNSNVTNYLTKSLILLILFCV